MKSSHRLAMQMARRAGLGVTVHAAESGPGSNVTQALEAYGASRIGHGYRALGGSAYEAARALGNVHFELCPTSSVATEAIERLGASHGVLRGLEIASRVMRPG